MKDKTLKYDLWKADFGFILIAVGKPRRSKALVENIYWLNECGYY